MYIYPYSLGEPPHSESKGNTKANRRQKQRRSKSKAKAKQTSPASCSCSVRILEGLLALESFKDSFERPLKGLLVHIERRTDAAKVHTEKILRCYPYFCNLLPWKAKAKQKQSEGKKQRRSQSKSKGKAKAKQGQSNSKVRAQNQVPIIGFRRSEGASPLGILRPG